MSAYFNSWSRLIGIAMLILALMFAVGMVRSRTIGDRITIYTAALSGETIRSEKGYLEYASWKTSRTRPGGSSLVGWDRWPLPDEIWSPDEDDGRTEYHFRCVLFGSGRSGAGGMSLAQAHRIWFVSYWVFVVPLTAFSGHVFCKRGWPASSKDVSSIPKRIPARRSKNLKYATLVLTGALIFAWARSLYFADQAGFSFDLHHRIYFCESINGEIRWKSFSVPNDAETSEELWDENDEAVEDVPANSDLAVPTYHGWKVTSRSENPRDFASAGGPDSDFRMGSQFLGFRRGDIVAINGMKSVPGNIWIVPYWSLVTPLSIVSAWLLLSREVDN